MTHRHGVDYEPVHRLAWETFEDGTAVAKELHLYGAGQDLVSDAFIGNVRGQDLEWPKWSSWNGNPIRC